MTRSKIRTSGAEGLTLSSTDITIDSGDLLFGTSAKGVNLGVTSNTDSNTIDDYEEGTFTATCANSVTLGSTKDLVSYVKIGKMVHIYGGVQVNDSNSSANFNFTNLPFTCVNSSEQSFQNVGITRPYSWNMASDCVQLICFAANGTSILYFTEIKDNGAEGTATADAGADMNFSIWYEAA